MKLRSDIVPQLVAAGLDSPAHPLAFSNFHETLITYRLSISTSQIQKFLFDSEKVTVCDGFNVAIKKHKEETIITDQGQV